MSPGLFSSVFPGGFHPPPFCFFMQLNKKKNRSKAKSFSNMNKDISTVFHAKYHASSINDRVSAVYL